MRSISITSLSNKEEKKFMRKITSLILVAVLIFGTFTFVFASQPSDIIDEGCEEAVKTLIALGIVEGYTDGTYKPEKVVSRAELIKLLIVALGYEDLATGTAEFSDTQGHWAEGYIGLATGLGYSKGYPDGTFKPDQSVSFDEAITMIVRGLGYNDKSLRGEWPVNYKIKAINLKILNNVTVKSSGADRGSVATILFNALMVEYGITGNDNVWKSSDELLVSRIGDKITGDLISYDDVYNNALSTAVDLEPYLFHIIDYYVNKNGEVAYISGMETAELEGTVTDVDKNGVMIVGNDNSFDFSADTTLLYNGIPGTDTDAYELSSSGNCEVKVIYNPNHNNKVTGITAWEYEIKQIENTYKVRKSDEIDSIALPSESNNLTIEGATQKLEDIAVGDLVYAYSSDDSSVVKLNVVRDTFEGRVTEIQDVNAAVVGGNLFVDGKDLSGPGIGDSKPGSIVKVYIDKDGEVYSWTTELDNNIVVEYGVYVGIAKGTLGNDPFDDNLTVAVPPRVKLFNDDGEITVYDIATDNLNLEGSDIVDLGDIDILCDLETGDVCINASENLEMGWLVEYTLNSEGKIDSIKIAETRMVEDENYDAEEQILANTYEMTEDTVVFDLRSDDMHSWSLTDDSSLGGVVSGSLIVDGNYYVDLIVVDSSDAEEFQDYTYAIVTKYTNYYDGVGPVQKLTVLENGEEKIYLTNGKDTVSEDALNTLQKLILDDSIVIDYEDPADFHNIESIAQINGNRIREYLGEIYSISDDAVVYIFNDDSIDSNTEDLSDILEGDEVKLINTDNLDAKYEIIILDLR